jgi:hypothetical protein
MKEGKVDSKAQENQARRIGLQDKLAEKVVQQAKNDQSALDRARATRFSTTGEPSKAPCAEEVA